MAQRKLFAETPCRANAWCTLSAGHEGPHEHATKGMPVMTPFGLGTLEECRCTSRCLDRPLREKEALDDMLVCEAIRLFWGDLMRNSRPPSLPEEAEMPLALRMGGFCHPLHEYDFLRSTLDSVSGIDMRSFMNRLRKMRTDNDDLPHLRRTGGMMGTRRIIAGEMRKIFSIEFSQRREAWGKASKKNAATAMVWKERAEEPGERARAAECRRYRSLYGGTGDDAKCLVRLPFGKAYVNVRGPACGHISLCQRASGQGGRGQ